MQTNKYIYHFLRVFSLTTIIMLCGCASQYIVDDDPDQLVAAMQDLPEVHPYVATANFYPELNNTSGKAKVTNADSRNLETIIYSEDEMLNLAGHASIFRWFHNDGQNEDDSDEIPTLNIHARIYKLDHSIKVEKGRMRPIAKTKLEIFITDSEENRIYESVFTAEAEGQQGELFRNKRETQDMYGYTIYKALTLAFESAFMDITNTLNLKPSDFDVDGIEIEQVDITENTPEKEKEPEEFKNLEDAVLEDT